MLNNLLGRQHSLFLNNEGMVYSWGNPRFGKLGREKDECDLIRECLAIPDYKTILFSILHVAVNIICVLDMKNDKFRIRFQSIVKFNFHMGGAAVLDVQDQTCGERHSYILFQNGDLYSFGNNDYGQLGHNNYLPCYQPSKIFFSEPINTFSAGVAHIFALTEKGNFYSWGTGQFGQLGNGQFQTKQKSPQLIKDFVNKGHIEMCINTIKMFLFKDQTFILLPNYEQAKIEKIERQKKTKNQVGSQPSSLNSSYIRQSSQNIQFSQSIIKPEQMNSQNKPVFSSFDGASSGLEQDVNQQEAQELGQNTLSRNVSNNQNNNNINSQIRSKRQLQNYGNLEEQKLSLQKEKEIIVKRMENIFFSRTEKEEKQRIQLQKIWENQIIPNWELKKMSQQVQELAFQGIPPIIRSKIWYKSIQNRLSITQQYFDVCLQKADKLMIFQEQKRYKQISENLINELESYLFDAGDDNGEGDKKKNKEDSIKMIENDLSRTFPHLAIFGSESPMQQSLRDVLMAFVIARPDIGYLQGMSYICAILILYMDKFKTFVCFSNLITLPSLMPFYLLNEEQVQQRLQLFKVIFNLTLPELCEHFEKECIQPKMYVFEWFLTLYTKTLSLSTVCRVLDLMFVQCGTIILYKVAISILKQLESSLMNCDIAGIMGILKKTENIIDEDELIYQTTQVKIPSWILQEIERLNTCFIP